MLEGLSSKLKIKVEYLLVALVVAIGMLIIPSAFNSSKTESLTSDTERYVEYLENKLKNSISEIDGVREVFVVIKVDSAIKTVIAEDVKSVEENGKVTVTSTPVLVGGEPIILGEIYPSITGVIVVCSCKNSLSVQMSVLDIVTTALDIPCDKVRILTQ